jgi:hypothetical protein
LNDSPVCPTCGTAHGDEVVGREDVNGPLKRKPKTDPELTSYVVKSSTGSRTPIFIPTELEGVGYVTLGDVSR